MLYQWLADAGAHFRDDFVSGRLFQPRDYTSSEEQLSLTSPLDFFADGSQLVLFAKSSNMK